jgi:hypoxanthine phosphoribosyltransferase
VLDGARALAADAVDPSPSAVDPRIGEIYLSAGEIRSRVAQLGAQIGEDYAGREPILVGCLKSSFIFLADLSRALPVVHRVDFVELAGYGGRGTGGSRAIRLLKDLDLDVVGQDVLLVEDVVDTGLTLHTLARTLNLRNPRSLAAVTFLDRPYRRLVEELPVSYVGFTVPDEFFVGYGFDLDERYRSLPDLHLATTGNGS